MSGGEEGDCERFEIDILLRAIEDKIAEEHWLGYIVRIQVTGAKDLEISVGDVFAVA